MSPPQVEADVVVAQVAAPRVATEDEEGEAVEGEEGEAGEGGAEASDGRGVATAPATSSRCCGARGTAADLLVVGLGNPGDEYARTRHNVGAEVVELLAKRHGATLKKGKERARVDRGAHRSSDCVALAIPLTYMNDSGLAVVALVRRYGVEPEQIVIVHDELDLPVGALKVKDGGGLAGHNGLRSIKAHLHSDAFLRVRIGVGQAGRRRSTAPTTC